MSDQVIQNKTENETTELLPSPTPEAEDEKEMLGENAKDEEKEVTLENEQQEREEEDQADNTETNKEAKVNAIQLAAEEHLNRRPSNSEQVFNGAIGTGLGPVSTTQAYSPNKGTKPGENQEHVQDHVVNQKGVDSPQVKKSVLKETTKTNQKKPKPPTNAEYYKSIESEHAKAQEAVQKGKKLVNIVTCFNCQNHQYCTHHKEQKYNQQFCELKKLIEDSNSSVHVVRNYNGKNLQIGAFEVFYEGQLVFSKLKTKYWPSHKWVVDRVSKMARGEISANKAGS